MAWDGKRTPDAPNSDAELKKYVNDWDALPEEQKTMIREALTFDFGDLPQDHKNRQLIHWVLENFVDTASTEEHRMTWDEENKAWIGSAYDASVNSLNGECKYWIDDVVTKSAFEGRIDLRELMYTEKTDANGNAVTILDAQGRESVLLEAYKWYESENIEMVATRDTSDDQTLPDLTNDSIIRSGDFIQLSDDASFNGQHTFIVGAITDRGVWIFDSNRVETKAPAYSFISNEILEETDKFTVYRLK